MRLPTPAEMMKSASAQTDALLALPNLLITLTGQLAKLTDALDNVNRLVQHLDDVVTDIEPGLRNLATTLESPVINTIPDTISHIQTDILPALLKLKGTADRFSQLAEQSSRLPGASLITGRRAQSRAASAAGSESESS